MKNLFYYPKIFSNLIDAIETQLISLFQACEFFGGEGSSGGPRMRP